MNRMWVREYRKWLRQVLQKETLTAEEMERILDGQMRLPERDIDAALVRKCRLALYPQIHGTDVPGKAEALERVRAFLQEESKRKGGKADQSAGAKRPFLLRPAAFAACLLVLVLLFGVSFDAVGFNVWRLISHWNEEIMEMRVALQAQIKRLDYDNSMGQTYADDFYRKLAEMEMTPKLPSKMPDGFVLEQAEGQIENEYLRWVFGTYICCGRRLRISIEKDISEDFGGNKYIEKDEREPDIYERDGMKFYITDNLVRSAAVWFEPPYVFSLTGDVSGEELRQNIDSIFERGIDK